MCALTALVFLVVKILVTAQGDPIDARWINGFIGLMAVLMALFGSLTVEVDTEGLRIRFGPGPVRKRWDIADIVAAEAMRTRVWYGWGIRLTPVGWLYNVSGFDAVRISLANGKSNIIGTDEPEELLKALHAAGVRLAGEAGEETD